MIPGADPPQNQPKNIFTNKYKIRKREMKENK